MVGSSTVLLAGVAGAAGLAGTAGAAGAAGATGAADAASPARGGECLWVRSQSLRENRRKTGSQAHYFDGAGTPVELWLRWRWYAVGFAVQPFRDHVREVQRFPRYLEHSGCRIVRLLDLSLGQLLGALGTAVKILTSERRELLPLTDLGCVG